MKRFMGSLICGAGAALGSIIVTSLVEDLRDPCKRATVKRFISNIKSKVFKKKES